MKYIFTTFWYHSKHVFTVKYHQSLSRELILLCTYLRTIKTVHCVSDDSRLMERQAFIKGFLIADAHVTTKAFN